MARGINKVILLGYVGQDPDVRYTSSGTPMCTFSLATTNKYKDQEYTEWHRIVAWQHLAEICSKYVKKGSRVYIEGSIRKNEYEDIDGEKHTSHQIVANTLLMLDRDRGSRSSGSSSSRSSQQPSSGQRSSLPSDSDDYEYDIPF